MSEKNIKQLLNAMLKFEMSCNHFECGYEWTNNGWVEKNEKGGLSLYHLAC
mgnify:CR=1 FL=1